MLELKTGAVFLAKMARRDVKDKLSKLPSKDENAATYKRLKTVDEKTRSHGVGSFTSWILENILSKLN